MPWHSNVCERGLYFVNYSSVVCRQRLHASQRIHPCCPAMLLGVVCPTSWMLCHSSLRPCAPPACPAPKPARSKSPLALGPRAPLLPLPRPTLALAALGFLPPPTAPPCKLFPARQPRAPGRCHLASAVPAHRSGGSALHHACSGGLWGKGPGTCAVPAALLVGVPTVALWLCEQGQDIGVAADYLRGLFCPNLISPSWKPNRKEPSTPKPP